MERDITGRILDTNNSDFKVDRVIISSIFASFLVDVYEEYSNILAGPGRLQEY